MAKVANSLVRAAHAQEPGIVSFGRQSIDLVK